MLCYNYPRMKVLPVDVIFVVSVGRSVGPTVVASVGACVGASVDGSLPTKVL